MIFLGFIQTPFAESNDLIGNIQIPAKMTLCGEPIPLNDTGVWEMLDREMVISIYDRAQVIMWLKRAGRYFPYIDSALKAQGMPLDLKYLAVAESSLITDISSPKGALGPWQFMTPTARNNGLRKDSQIDERRDFERATSAALKYLKNLKKMFGKWHLAMAAYNCGESRLRKRIKDQKTANFFKLDLPKETERYIFRIAAIKLILENPGNYGYNPEIVKTYRPLKYDSVKVNNNRRIHITKFAKALGTHYKTIRELNPHFRKPYLPTGKYYLKVPTGSGRKAKSALKRLGKSSPAYGKIKGGHYIVRPGDTLSNIAKQTGVSIGRLRSLNNIKGSLIKSGQKLRIRN